MRDEYFNRGEVSNSDLSWLKKYWMPEAQIIDFEKAYKFGTLVDAVITEPHKVDYYQLTVDGVQYSAEDFDKVVKMKAAFDKDEFCQGIAAKSEFQRVDVNNGFEIEHDGLKFQLNARCKWDFFMPSFNWGADLKSTAATTQKQFEEAVRYFDYDRQRAWYMDLAGTKQDMLIGISKVNFKIFKVPIPRDSDLYKSGKAKYEELAFKWWYLFDNF